MQRYKFTEKGIAQAIKFLKGKVESAPAWVKRFKDDLTVQGRTVYYKSLPIIVQSEVENYLRKSMFSKGGKLPFGRDAAFHKLKQTTVGITRRHLMRFIKSQDVFEQTKNAVPKAKAKGGKRIKSYTVESDLIFIRKNDLVNNGGKRFEKTVGKEETYICSSTEKSTGLCRLDYVKSKDARLVTPIVIKHIRSIAKALKVHPRSVAYRSDFGGEFDLAKIRQVVPDAENVRVGASIEKKNQDAQRVFYRILKSRRAVNIPNALSEAQDLLNETYNRVQGATPNELVEKSTKTFNLKSYNKSRGTYIAGDNRKPFVVGQRVRVQIKKDKGGDLGYKSYKNMTFSKRVYIVRKITNTTPRKYWVNGKWYLQDKLKLTEVEDEKTKEMVAQRDKAQEEKDEKEEEKRSAEAAKAEEARLKKKAVKEKEGVIPTTRQTAFKEKLKKQREVGEALDRELAKRKRPGRKRRVVVRSRKHEREGEEEWLPDQERRPRRKRKPRVRRV